MKQYENAITHSNRDELRRALGSAVEHYVDAEDKEVIWMRMRGETEFTPHLVAADWVDNAVETGDSGGGTEGPQGPQGEKGDQGEIGPQGPEGPQGPQGPQGEQGKPFQIKAIFTSIEDMNAALDSYEEGDCVIIQGSEVSEDNGKLYQKFDGSWEYLTDMSNEAAQGPQGPEGPQGPQGAEGAQGEQGPQGPEGASGQDGKSAYELAVEGGFEGSQEDWLLSLKGEKGDQGEIGPQGPEGPQGADATADPDIVKYQGEDKSVIPLPINGSIAATQNTETGEGGVLICQRDYGEGNVTEVGNVRNKLTFNATERPQLDLPESVKEQLAYLSDLEAKQDKLTAGTGINIDESGTISSTIDLSLFKLVTELPTTDIDSNKIYLIQSTTKGKNNIYTEYVYINNDWEIVGEYKSVVDLTPYLTKEDAANTYQPKGDYATLTEGKDIILPMNGSIAMIQDEETGSGGVIICQRDYGEGNVTEVGNVRNKLTFNATERPQLDMPNGVKEKLAYESDLIKYGMFYPGIKVDTQKLFALTKSSTEDDIKAALQLETASGGYTLPTEDILNDCLGKGYQLLSNWMPVNIAWNGAAWVFYLVGQTYMNQPNAVATVSIKITDEVYSIFQAAKVTKLASIDDLKLMPNVIRFPLRTLQDKVYTQEEILEWFGVTEVSDLKQQIASGGIHYLQYGISLSSNPHYYKMPVEYVAFESANQIKLAFTGLNTRNDAPAKYEILMNLDGTILEDNCNVQITMTELPTVDNLPSTSEIEGDIEALINRVQAVEDQLIAVKQTNIQAVDTLDSDVNNSDSDLVVSATATDKVVSLTGKSVQVKDTEVTNSRMNIVASNGDVNISNLTTSGTLAKSTANAAVSINNNDYVKITNTDWKQSGYNAIEIGLTDGNAPKGVIIDGIDFASKLDNNCILIFAHQPNAVITISNCHIADASNFLRISNRTNVPATINLINCQIDKWDERSPWQGIIILEDYTSKNADEANEANRFANLTINFNNVIGPDGKVINPSDVSKILGTGKDDQIAYIYHDNGDGLIAYDEAKYPKFTFK